MAEWLKIYCNKFQKWLKRVLWLYEDIRNKLYSIRTAEKAEPKSDENYREEENNNHFAFKITRKVFAMNCEFAFDIRRGANLHLVLKP